MWDKKSKWRVLDEKIGLIVDEDLQKGDDKMTETRQTVFRQTKEEYGELKRDAHAHNMNVSEYIRYLVAKERKEREK